MSEPDAAQVKIIKANVALQQKAGTGDVDAKKIEKAEHTVQNNNEDFLPIAAEFLDRLELGVARARQDGISMTEKIAGMTKPVMELKANARMFKYDLVTSLANVMLGFLENIKDLDRDAIEIVAAHHTTLKAIIIKKMKGDGGANGSLLRAELEDACQRYFRKRKPA
jgi:hypothetical protein